MRPLRRLALAVTAGPLLLASVFAAATPTPVADTAVSSHFSAAGHIVTPGRPMSIAWSPGGDKLALGGHFGDKTTGQRYDTRTADVRSRTLLKSYDCHYWWAISQVWSKNPYLGEVIVDGGGDHMVKIWDAAGPGSPKCNPGQFRTDHGALQGLGNINGWITSLAFSPDGKYLAGAGKDRTIRIWQIVPGPNQFRVVKLWYDKPGGQFLSVRWAADGKRLVTGNRSGRVRGMALRPRPMCGARRRSTSTPRSGSRGSRRTSTRTRRCSRATCCGAKARTSRCGTPRYSPDGKKIAAVGTDGTLDVYEAKTGRVLYRTQAPKLTPLRALDWSPDGLLLTAGGGDKAVYVFGAANDALYDTLLGHKTLVTAVSWSPNGRTLATRPVGHASPKRSTRSGRARRRDPPLDAQVAKPALTPVP